MGSLLLAISEDLVDIFQMALTILNVFLCDI